MDQVKLSIYFSTNCKEEKWLRSVSTQKTTQNNKKACRSFAIDNSICLFDQTNIAYACYQLLGGAFYLSRNHAVWIDIPKVAEFVHFSPWGHSFHIMDIKSRGRLGINIAGNRKEATPIRPRAAEQKALFCFPLVPSWIQYFELNSSANNEFW